MDDGPIFPVPLTPRPSRTRGYYNQGSTDRPGSRLAMGVTQEGSPTQALVDLGVASRASGRQIRRTYSLRHDAEPTEAKRMILCCQENS